MKKQIIENQNDDSIRGGTLINDSICFDDDYDTEEDEQYPKDYIKVAGMHGLYPPRHMEVDGCESGGVVSIENGIITIELSWDAGFCGDTIEIPLKEFCDKFGLIKKEENK